MLDSPFAQWDNAGFRDERTRLAFALTGDGGPFVVVKWVPQTFGLSIENQENVLVDISTDAELVVFVLTASSVNHGQCCERSPTDGDGFALEVVVDQFVVIEERGRIGPCDVVFDITDDHDLVVSLWFLCGSIGTWGNLKQSPIA